MKKWVALVLAAVMIFAVTASLAEEKTFDLSLVEKLPNYKYDKMEKQWIAYGCYEEKYSDGTLSLTCFIMGDKNGCRIPTLCCEIEDVKNQTLLVEVTSMKILIDDELYTANYLVNGFALLGENGKRLVRAIAESDEMTIRLYCDEGSGDFELDATTDYAELKRMCENLIEVDVWAYVDDAELELEALCGFVVE